MARKPMFSLLDKLDIYGLYWHAPSAGTSPSFDDLGRMFKCSSTTILNAVMEVQEIKNALFRTSQSSALFMDKGFKRGPKGLKRVFVGVINEVFE